MRPSRLLAPLASAAFFALFTAPAFAQDATPPPAAPSSGAAPAAPAGANTPLEDQGRMWIGFNVNGGVGTGANLSGPAFGGTFRIGYSLDHLMGIYANITPIVWAASASSTVGGGSVSLSAIDGILLNPMFALTPIDLFEVAAGPSLDYLTGGSVSVNGQSGSANAFSSAYFGIDGRIALHLGGRNPDTGRRRGFTISGDVHPSFVSGGPVTFITAGLGADWY